MVARRVTGDGRAWRALIPFLSMPLTREFLGTERPALVSAADYLFTRYLRGAKADFRNVTVVTPGRRAGRRLLEILVDGSESRKTLLVPPDITTVGTIPERLYRPKRPFAGDFTQRLAWAETLRAMSAAGLAPLIRFPPDPDDSAEWLQLADLIRRQHSELAADGFDFSDVLQVGGEADDFQELARWRTLDALQKNYLRRLDELELWDIQTARLVAVEQRECQTDRDIVLVGTVDMTRTLRQMLDQVADRVTALVFAPPDWSDRFDKYGCVIPEAWLAARLPIAAEHVSVVDGPSEQATRVADWIADLDGKYAADEIAIGVPDPEMIPELERTLAARGVTVRWGAGVPVGETAPIRFLQVLAGYVAHGRYSDFAALVRHPDVTDWMASRKVAPDYLERLDEYHEEHLPYKLEGEWLGSSGQTTSLRQALKAVDALTRPLREPSRKLPEWSAAILQVLLEIYGTRVVHREIESHRAILEALEAIDAALQEFARIPSPLLPAISAAGSLQWVIDEVRSKTIPPPIEKDAIELLGWLELPLDDAPVLVVTSLNEGFVPESVNSDLFLPNALRRRLGLLDNDRRYARDACAVSVMAATRKAILWVVARRNRQGDPAIPSRLLFATDGDAAARRALLFFRPPADPPRTPPFAQDDRGSPLVVPRPRPLDAPVTSLRITSFRDFIACRYRFYLRHVLNLETIDDQATELDGGGFGSLVHAALRQFGTGKIRDSNDPEEIRQALNHELNQYVANTFGREPSPAVRVQIENARMRLNAFAEVQAAWTDQGWRIEFTEVGGSRECPVHLIVDGQPMEIRGRIDRIDVHPAKGERIIWDYKTSNSAERPDKAHRAKGEWVDLQLPLYRHIAKALDIAPPLRLGYILLPQDVNRVEFCLAEWSDAELSEADARAFEIIRDIRRECFWPPNPIPPVFSDDFARICQEGVLGGGERPRSGDEGVQTR